MAAQRKRGEATSTVDRESITSIVESLRVIVKAMRASGRETERKLGISSAQLQILHELRDHPALSINQLAGRTSTHQSSVSMVVAKLVASRLVTRTPSGSDARKILISLTSAGKGLLRRSPMTAEGPVVNALRSLPLAEVQDLAQGLETLSGRISSSLERS